MNKLDQLKAMTDVVADTGDIEAMRAFKPMDATTNPSLLLKASALPQYDALMTRLAASIEAGSERERIDRFADAFAVAIGCEILDIVPGRVSTEVDARLSFDIDRSVAKARHLIGLYKAAGVPSDRILIKLASTWEGLEAARVLEAEGIQCNLTLMFCDVQAVAAAKAGAFLISPFVGRILDWYKAAEGVEGYAPDDDPGVKSVRNIFNLYKDRGFKTVVMGASFRNVGEIEALAGCDRLTIGPNFLEDLADDDGPLPQKLFADKGGDYTPCDFSDEADFRYQLNADAMATEKLAEGIRGFARDQIKLEKRLGERLATAG
ncbi:MAG: transaldolase [Pseudomonadota bacterium]